MLTTLILAAAVFGQTTLPQITHSEDETSLVRIKADPKKYIGETFIISGGGLIGSYYKYGYRESKLTHTNIIFIELGKNSSEHGERAYLYAHRVRCKPIIDELVEVLEQNKVKGTGRVFRVKATIAHDKFYQGKKRWNMLELRDLQFAIPGTDPVEWEPWILEEEEKKAEPPPQPREWADETGKFSMKGTFSGVIGDQVRLRKEDGSTVSVTISKLRKEDQDYIKTRAK
jgi:hypothetical protein